MNDLRGLIVVTAQPACGPSLGPSWSSTPAIVPVANQLPVTQAVAAMRELGITEPVVAVDAAMTDAVLAAVGTELSEPGWPVRWLAVEEPAGAAAALRSAGDKLGNGDWLVWIANGVFTGDLAPIVARFQRERPTALITTCAPSGDVDAAPLLDGNRLVGVEVAPIDGSADLELGGIALLGPGVADAVARLRPSWRGRLELAEALDALAAGGNTIAHEHTEEWWPCTGGASALLEANRAVLDRVAACLPTGWMADSELSGRVLIHPTATVESSTIRGPAVVGAGARIRDSYVGPYTSLGDEVVLEGSEIEDSIVCRGAQISRVGTRLERSLVGSDARLTRELGLPRTLRVWVGERTEVALA